ncbi:Hypothetical predicted protein [Paramuricea clavata]|uniref:Uncharacterized protein n=1 Tax=Paramuricea clavata TaxID=317549 RepID=A0A6S7H3D0_PARCT|nr:Hypothetical predicted protein [Paramuricea clavata]
MSAQVKILYGHNYERCKVTRITVNELNRLNLNKLESLVLGVVGNYYNGEKIRMQYRDDEETFVTISNESDVKDAVLAATPVQNTGDFKLTRLCIRVDDVLTPVVKCRASRENENARSSANFATQSSLKSQFEPEVINDSKRKRLYFDGDVETEQDDNVDFFDSDSSEESLSVETPYQRYMKKAKSDIDEKKAELQKLEMDEREIHRKFLLVKSNPDNGNLCRTCHLRLGHTARNCEYGKCQSVFSCGEEKFHPGEIDTRGMRCSIKKKKSEIAKLEKDLTLKEEASRQLSGMLSTRIENALMQENRSHYIEGGQKKWLNLRKDVCIIEKYCKEQFNGKIPPKHKVSDILHAALQQRDKYGCDGKDLNQVRKRGNRAIKGLLEQEGICFPKPKDAPSTVPSGSEDNPNMLTKHPSSVLRTAPSNIVEETEQLNMVLKQSLLDSSHMPSSTTTPSYYPTFHPYAQTPFVFNQQMGMPTFPYCPSRLPDTSMQYPNVDMPPALQQSPFHEAIRQGETELAQTFPLHARETKVISHSTDSRMPTDALSYAEPPENSSLYDNEVPESQCQSNVDKDSEERDAANAATQLMNLVTLGAQRR